MVCVCFVAHFGEHIILASSSPTTWHASSGGMYYCRWWLCCCSCIGRLLIPPNQARTQTTSTLLREDLFLWLVFGGISRPHLLSPHKLYFVEMNFVFENGRTKCSKPLILHIQGLFKISLIIWMDLEGWVLLVLVVDTWQIRGGEGYCFLPVMSGHISLIRSTEIIIMIPEIVWMNP